MVLLKINEHINDSKGWKYQELSFDVDKALKKEFENRVVELYFNNIPLNEAIKQVNKELGIDHKETNRWFENIIKNSTIFKRRRAYMQLFKILEEFDKNKDIIAKELAAGKEINIRIAKDKLKVISAKTELIKVK
ncbi:hypothetical protein [Clostridium novyi]|uniref:hypothetical protein n=1 Tax=Clostridium novyi TaxID=1542 RepID=UPI0004D86E60|nr:hypothetical protein [Clostridium novyi]KEI12609.1 hypothetical protein Z958_05940 [Clostridium novyi B str. NCTC 9691]